ncbi:MAG: Ribulose-phosphate 3-epimerase [Ignavibacteria bacterium]|nr:Ribulose-phosphate 3-epimerase [Ignavibacteria bacterium]
MELFPGTERKSKVKIAPSLLAANFANLESDIRQCVEGGADILHLDIMDGHFVPNLTIGPPVVKAIRSLTTLPFSCHLMISDPYNYIREFAEAGANYISVHVEGHHHLHRTLALIRSFGIKPGIALNPGTPLDFAFEAAEYCDYILLMSVDPGFGGQKFIPTFLRRCEMLRIFLEKQGYDHIEIEVDGGVKHENIARIARTGASILVCGSAVFNGDIVENIKDLRHSVEGISFKK